MYHDKIQSVMDAVDACQELQTFTAGQTLESYKTDRLRRLAIERLFEILGEALNRVEDTDPSFRDHLPEMGKVIGMRNRLAHGYDRVNHSLVWDTVQDFVPDLQSKLTAWLEKNG